MAIKNIDMVFVLDVTGNMGFFVDRFRRNLLPMLRQRLSERAETARIRFRIITFRDYMSDGEEAIYRSRFYLMPEEEAELNRELQRVECYGGGDSPENGMEALYFALTSDFAAGEESRQYIFLFTNADAVEIGKRADCSGYPQDMPSEEEIAALWKNGKGLSKNGKKLVLVAPKETVYQKLFAGFDDVFFCPTSFSGLLDDLEFSPLLDKAIEEVM